ARRVLRGRRRHLADPREGRGARLPLRSALESRGQGRPDHSRGGMDGPRATSRPVVKPTTFYFVRHGESEGNAAHVFTGQTDSPLTARGRQQAAIVADELAKVKFDRIASGELSRTRDPAQVIARRQTLPVEKP